MDTFTVQVAEVVREVVEMGQADAAAQMAADLAHRGLSVACDVIVQLAKQVHSPNPVVAPQSAVRYTTCRLIAHVCRYA